MFADEVEDKVEVLLSDIDLVPLQCLVYFDEMLPAVGFYSPDFVEIGNGGVAGGGQRPCSCGGRPLSEYSDQSRPKADFSRPIELGRLLLVYDALLVHCEMYNVLATVHPDHDQVGDDNYQEEYDDNYEPYFYEAVPYFRQVIVDGCGDERDQQWNTEQNAENLEDEEKDGRVLQHIQRIGPTVFAVLA